MKIPFAALNETTPGHNKGFPVSLAIRFWKIKRWLTVPAQCKTIVQPPMPLIHVDVQTQTLMSPPKGISIIIQLMVMLWSKMLTCNDRQDNSITHSAELKTYLVQRYGKWSLTNSYLVT